MQAVATELRVPVMTLYTYVRSKDELLTLLADHVGDLLYTVPAGNLPWRDLLHSHAMSLLRELTDHPGYADLMFFHGRISGSAHGGDKVMSYMERSVEALTEGGLSLEQATRAHYSISLMTMSFALWTAEDRVASRNSPPMLAALQGLMWVDLGRFPHLRRARDFLPLIAGEDQFRFMLDTFLDGIAALADRNEGDTRRRPKGSHI